MNPGFPKRPIIERAPNTQQFGGNGRYLYILSGGFINVFDGDLITGLNVSGASWIVNPFITSIVPPTGTISITYDAYRNSLICVGNVNGNITAINCDTFAQTTLVSGGAGMFAAFSTAVHEDTDTICGTNAYGLFVRLSANQSPIPYNYSNDSFMMQRGSCLKIIDGEYYIQSAGFYNPYTFKYKPFGGIIVDVIKYNNFYYCTGVISLMYIQNTNNIENSERVGVVTGLVANSQCVLNTKNRKIYCWTNGTGIRSVNLDTNTSSALSFLGLVSGSWHEYSNTFITAGAGNNFARVLDCENEISLPNLSLSSTTSSSASSIALIAANRKRFDG